MMMIRIKKRDWILAEFTHVFEKVPVIVITGEGKLIKGTFRDYNVIDVIDKGEFDDFELALTIQKEMVDI